MLKKKIYSGEKTRFNELKCFLFCFEKSIVYCDLLKDKVGIVNE